MATTAPSSGDRIIRGCIDVVRAVVKDAPADDAAWSHVGERYGLANVCRDHADELLDALGAMCEAFANAVNEEAESDRNRAVSAIALNYVLMPFDVIPQSDARTGRYGFVDDALFAYRAMILMEDDRSPEMDRLADDLAASYNNVWAALGGDVRDRLSLAFRQMMAAAVATTELGS